MEAHRLPLAGKTVCVCVTGGIAAYKACEIVSRLRKLGAAVLVIMTEHAAQFVTPLTFETLSGNPVVSDMFARVKSWEVEHISIAKRSDLFIIAPATANVIGKLAGGIADDMLTTTVMATLAPVLVCPAMNANMYRNPILQRNLEILGKYYQFVGPEAGRLACGDSDVGRMSEPADIVKRAVELLCCQKA